MKNRRAYGSRQVRLLRTLIAVSGVAVLVSGCGGGSTSSSGGSSSASSLSSAELAQKANALCGQANASIARVWKETPQTQDPQAGAAAGQQTATKVANLADQYNAQLRALKPPPQAAAAYARFIAAYERQASKLHTMVQSLKAGRSVRTNVMAGSGFVAFLPAAAESDRAESSRLAKRLGLSACTGSTSGGQ